MSLMKKLLFIVTIKYELYVFILYITFKNYIE